MRRDPQILEERGCFYSFDRVSGWMHLAYRWLHLPTGKSGLHRAYFLNHGSFLELLSHWNRDPRWKYSPR